MRIEDIKTLEDRRFAALLAGNIKALAPLLHADLRYVHSNGDADTRDAYLAALRQGTTAYLAVARSNETIIVRGTTALVFSRLDMAIRYQGQPKQVHSNALAVWVEDQGIWQLIALQSAAVRL
jgi:ketosteroid isomerase-like protein